MNFNGHQKCFLNHRDSKVLNQLGVFVQFKFQKLVYLHLLASPGLFVFLNLFAGDPSQHNPVKG